MDHDHDVKVLNTLIATTIDSALGFEESADEVNNGEFASEFRRYAQERRQVIVRLQAEVGSLGGTPEDDGTTKGAAHRRWLDFKNSVTGADDKAVVSEVRNGETYIREKYETALKDDKLSVQTRSVISEAFQSVRSGHERASALNQSLKQSGS